MFIPFREEFDYFVLYVLYFINYFVLYVLILQMQHKKKIWWKVNMKNVNINVVICELILTLIKMEWDLFCISLMSFGIYSFVLQTLWQ